ncbi:MAG: Flp family type IVb pilin [Chloroflexota bacterium]
MTSFSMLLHYIAGQRGAGEDGQDMIEYGLLAGLISIAAIAALVLVGPPLIGLYQHIAGQVATYL